jgi:hypothetical protein
MSFKHAHQPALVDTGAVVSFVSFKFTEVGDLVLEEAVRSQFGYRSITFASLGKPGCISRFITSVGALNF